MSNVTQLSTSTRPIPESWVTQMFAKMSLDYGKKFVDQWDGADTKKLIAHWSQELAGYSGAEIKRGLAAMETLDWPPSLPQFKKLCRPPVDALVAYYEAVNEIAARERGEVGNWTHPAIYWAAVKIGAFDLKNQSFSAIKVRWEKAFSDEMAKGEWTAIPAPMVALVAPGQAQLSREEAARRLDQLGASEMLKPKGDLLDWARRIKKREAEGDSTLKAIQIRFANNALSN